MTLKQQILKWVYPIFVGYKNWMGKNKSLVHDKYSMPNVPFHSLIVNLNNGADLPLETLKNKKVLIVNTASNCGYTRQYEELQKLYNAYREKLVVIAFPSNNFKEQEKGSDEEIASFCQVNFGVTFPIASKSVVIKTLQQNKVFEWLTHKELNGWNDKPPSWNFSKYLVNEDGSLTHYFDPAVSPLSVEVQKAINNEVNLDSIKK